MVIDHLRAGAAHSSGVRSKETASAPQTPVADAGTEQPKSGATGGIDTVQLSDAAQALLKTEKLDASSAPVDTDRVEKIKAQVENGTYEVDAMKVAEGMINFDRQI